MISPTGSWKDTLHHLFSPFQFFANTRLCHIQINRPISHLSSMVDTSVISNWLKDVQKLTFVHTVWVKVSNVYCNVILRLISWPHYTFFLLQPWFWVCLIRMIKWKDFLFLFTSQQWTYKLYSSVNENLNVQLLFMTGCRLWLGYILSVQSNNIALHICLWYFFPLSVTSWCIFPSKTITLHLYQLSPCPPWNWKCISNWSPKHWSIKQTLPLTDFCLKLSTTFLKSRDPDAYCNFFDFCSLRQINKLLWSL